MHLARERFEKDLAVKNKLQDDVMDYHFNKIESDRRQCEQERHAKKQKQLRFKQTMEDQIEGNTEARREKAIFERLPISTSFGPEEGHNENTALWKKKLEQQ